MAVHKVAVPPGVILRMCEDCRKKQDEYQILKMDVEGECEYSSCENRESLEE